MTTTSENPNDRFNRIETTLERLAQLTFQNAARYDANLNRHDDAIAQLLEVTSRNSESINRHDETLRRLEANAERMEQAVTNLSNTVTNNNNKIEQAITNLTNRLDTFIERSDAERETFIDEIRQIWRYLRYEPGNGTSHSDND